MNKIIISTTTPETLATILKYQPRFLSDYFNVTLVTSPGKMLEQVTHNEELEIHVVEMIRGINILKDIQALIKMKKVLCRVKPELVHSYTPKAGLVTMLAAWICRVPVRIHTFTGLIFPTTYGFRKKLLILIDRLICTCATHIVPEGLGVKKDLEYFRITHKPLNVIGYGNISGVDTSYFSLMAPGVIEDAFKLRISLSIRAENFTFCYVGRLNIDKGISELMVAFSRLPQETHLLLVGSLDQTAPIEEATWEFIRSHPRVHHIGFINDVRPALQIANVLVLPSYREGFPNVVLQAGSMEVPVIATDINGCNEIIEPGFNGWLVPPCDAQALAEAMKQAMQMPASMLSTMGKHARDRIQQYFEQRQHWERMQEFYQGLLDAQNKSGN
jgi:glycosyltransferase involved in cell wall biosynthesis